jgi:methionine aminotransferase
MQLPQKHSATGTTIFTVMSALAAEHSAINLSQGFPDFPIDERLGTLLHVASTVGFNQYAPMPGLPLLRENIAKGFHKRYGLNIDHDREITITPGATYAIYAALTAILQPGDEVIILEPAYDSYIPNIEMNGARAIPVSLSAPDFSVDWNKVKSAVNGKTKAIIVNTPHNPTGAVWQKGDWDQLAEIVRDSGIFILSDEVYEQLIYDNEKHYSVLEHPELRARSFALYSFGKVYHNTGWKIGYCIASPALTTAFRQIHQFLSFSVNTPSQYALAQYLQLEDVAPVNIMLQEKRDYFLDLVKQTPFTIHKPTSGSYFQLASYEQISDLPDMEFAQWLTREHGVAVIPVSAFYSSRQDDKLVRFCFAKKEETLDAAMGKLAKLIPAAAL